MAEATVSSPLRSPRWFLHLCIQGFPLPDQLIALCGHRLSEVSGFAQVGFQVVQFTCPIYMPILYSKPIYNST